MQTPFYLPSALRGRALRFCERAVLGIVLILASCAGGQIRSKPSVSPQTEARTLSQAPAAPIAYWRQPQDQGRGTPIQAGNLEPILTEMAGRRALQEAVLDEVLTQELARQAIVLDSAAIATEQTILLAALDSDIERAQRLLTEIRRREGLGPYRFAALLRRNASMRALVEGDVVMRDGAVRAAWDARHGPRRVTRVFVADDVASCTEALAQIEAGASFSEVAAQRSSDPSASTGGLIDPVSELDPSWPAAFRETVWSLTPGQISSPVLVDGEYVVVQFIEEQKGDGITLEQARTEAIEMVRRAQERLLMDAMAQRLLESTQVDIIDSELRRAWQNDPNAIMSPVTSPARLRGQ